MVIFLLAFAVANMVQCGHYVVGFINCHGKKCLTVVEIAGCRV